MGTVKLRVEGITEDVEALSTFFRKISQHITAFKVLEESKNYKNRDSVKVRRYVEVYFDSSALEVND